MEEEEIVTYRNIDTNARFSKWFDYIHYADGVFRTL